MKSLLALYFAFACLTIVRGEEPKSLEEILQKRDSLLTQIVEQTESLHQNGAKTGEQVREAKLSLYTFRRDSAKTQPERIQWQSQIVAVEKAAESRAKKNVEVGIATSFDLLVAQERILAAEQKLIEIQTAK